MPQNYQQDIHMMKYPNYYYYGFKEILSYLYCPSSSDDFYSRPIYADLPIPFASDRYLPVPNVMVPLTCDDPLKHQNKLISMTSLEVMEDSNVAAGDFDRQVRIRYSNMLYSNMRRSLLLMPGVEANIIPTICASTTWHDIVNFVNLAYLVKNGFIKTYFNKLIK